VRYPLRGTYLKYVLDTNIVSLVARKNKAATKRYEQHIDECVIPSIVWHELQYGAHSMKEGPIKRQFLSFYDTLDHIIVTYDQKAAEYHAAERIRLGSSKFVDAQIASIAVTHNMVLVTANTRDFKGFQGIQLEDWSH